MYYYALEKTFSKLVKAFNYVGAYICLMIMFITVADVAGRYFLGKNILGIYEITEAAMVLIVFLGVAYTEKIKAHVSVEIFVARAPERLRKVIDVIIYCVTLAFFSLMTYATTIRALQMMKSGQTSQELFIPVYPFLFIIVVSYAFLCLAIVFNLISSITGVIKK